MAKEFILCAAIFYNNQIIAGYRHADCLKQIAKEDQKFVDNYINTADYTGFLTSTNEFVNRKEAYRIAFFNDQIIGPNKGCQTNEIGLTSEDLY